MFKMQIVSHLFIIDISMKQIHLNWPRLNKFKILPNSLNLSASMLY